MATVTSQFEVGRRFGGEHRVLVRVPPEFPEVLVRALTAGRGGCRRLCGASLAGAGQVRGVARRPGDSGDRILGGRCHATRLPTILESHSTRGTLGLGALLVRVRLAHRGVVRFHLPWKMVVVQPDPLAHHNTQHWSPRETHTHHTSTHKQWPAVRARLSRGVYHR